MKKIFCPVGIAILMSSCAASFKSINPSTFNNFSKSENSDVEMAYKYDVLRERGNKKYAKKEWKAGIRLVAIRITNTSGKTIQIGDNARLYTENSEVRLWPSDLIHKRIKQTVPLYLLYLLLTPSELTTTSGTGEVGTFPIGLILGPGLAGGNMAVAGSANSRLKQELSMYNLLDKSIRPGETVYAIAGIPESGFVPLRLVVNP